VPEKSLSIRAEVMVAFRGLDRARGAGFGIERPLEVGTADVARDPSTALRTTIFISAGSAGRLSRQPLIARTHLLFMIRKLQSGEYRLYSRKKDAKTGKKKNLGTFASRAAAEKHERAVQYFKRA
jgi:hypothetical protein